MDDPKHSSMALRSIVQSPRHRVHVFNATDHSLAVPLSSDTMYGNCAEGSPRIVSNQWLMIDAHMWTSSSAPQKNKAACADAVPLSWQRVIFSGYKSSWRTCCWLTGALILQVGVVLTMLDLHHECCGPCEVTVLLCGWHKALSTFLGSRATVLTPMGLLPGRPADHSCPAQLILLLQMPFVQSTSFTLL